MDKLRALHYLAAAADGASLSAAARRFDVSVAAISKSLDALERALGVRLLERHPKGIALTAAGVGYLEACRGALAQLAEADEVATASLSQTYGTVVVGVQPVIAQECLTAALPRFNLLYPEIQLDVRFFMRPSEEQTSGVDVMLVLGWPQHSDDFVRRTLGAASFIVCASPNYWNAHGMPRHPRELESHNCLCIRSNAGSVMDLWHFRKGGERVSVTARGWLITDNAHRDMVRDLVLAGAGVARLLDWHQRQGREIASGALLPALTDWSEEEVPPVNLLYRPSVRRIPRVRLFIDYVVQLFADIETQRPLRAPATGMPRWLKGRRARASATE